MDTAPANPFRQPTRFELAAGWLRRLPLGRSTAVFRGLYRLALTAASFGRGLPCYLPGGEVVRVSSDNRYMSWNEAEYAAFRAATTPGTVVFDVGANVGAYALLFGQWAGAHGRVFAFEPSPAAFAGLNAHVRLNGLTGVVTSVQAAVGAQPEVRPFVVASTAGEGRLATPLDDARTTVPVPVTTIDEFCRRENVTPDLIKIDVEGAELEVLRGARETIARTRGRLALFVELHPAQWAARGVARGDIEGELERLALAVTPIVDGVDPWAVEGMAARLVPR